MVSHFVPHVPPPFEFPFAMSSQPGDGNAGSLSTQPLGSESTASTSSSLSEPSIAHTAGVHTPSGSLSSFDRTQDLSLSFSSSFSFLSQAGSSSQSLPQAPPSTPDPDQLTVQMPFPPPAQTLRTKITLSVRSKIRALRTIALWPFRKIADEFELPVSTVFTVCAQPNTPTTNRIGRPRALTEAQREQLIVHATSTQANRRKSLFTIAEELGYRVNERTLRRVFSEQGYHRRIARAKPFLTVNNKVARQEFSDCYQDWSESDWMKVIWTDECAFNVGGFSGNTWVTRLPAEEYIEDCLVPKFRKLETIMVWGCIFGNQKGPLVIWDKSQWGATINGPSYCKYIILPHLHTFWQDLCAKNLGYIYLQQDGASPHRAKYTQKVLSDLGMLNYFFKWPASSPDLNPIEHVWRSMKQRIYQRNPRPTSNALLRAAIQEEWDLITNEEIASIIQTMPARVAAVRQAAGGHTSY